MADELRKQRSALKGKLTIFANYINEFQTKVDAGETLSNSDLANIRRRLSNVEPLLDRFEALVIDLPADPVGDEVEFVELRDFQNKFYDATAKADCFLNNEHDLPAIATSENNRSSPTPSEISVRSQGAATNFNSIRLPTIELPKYSGKSENWLEYRDLFMSLIHDNDALNPAQKFHYLRASLQGEAGQVIKAIDFCSDNYALAWDTLNARYNSPRVLVHNHVKSLFSLEQINKESSAKIRSMLDAVSKHIRSIKTLTSEQAFNEALIIYLITSKLDSITLRHWEENVSGNKLPSFEELKTFLNSRADLLETLESKTTKQFSDKNKTSSKSFFVANQNTCEMCGKDHHIWSCELFLSCPVRERLEKVKGLKLCILCLKRGHFINNCKSKYACGKCKKRHNILLHENTNATPIEEGQQTVAAVSSNISQVLLPTAMVKVKGSDGKLHSARILMDSCSQSNLIITSSCKKLNLNTNSIQLTIQGINGSSSHAYSKCDVELQSHTGDCKLMVSCVVVDKITSYLPDFKVNVKSWKIPENIKLADPSFYKSGSVQILLGAQHFWDLLCVGQISLGLNAPILQESKFGWLVSGPVTKHFSGLTQCHFAQTNVEDVQGLLSKFWELEQGPESRSLSKEEKACEAHYVENTCRDSQGRFIVALPLKERPEKLGNSRDQAEKRFLALERRLQHNKELKDRYTTFMSEYEKLGHMSLSNPNSDKVEFYLPHHGVLKEESVSTKLRVVFDGSAHSTSGYSLNSIQMVGPTIQQDLFTILLRFRKGRCALSADIEKMYRQVMIRPEQRQLQKILWRPNINEPIKEFTLNTVTYGTASASFLAIRSLYQVGLEHEISHPTIAKIIKSDFYVDDLLTSVDTLEEAKLICETLPKILATGCFKICKWISNEPEALDKLDQADKHPNFLKFGEHEHTKTLGLTWCDKTDNLLYSIGNSSNEKITKRTMLSQIAQIFDPLGLLSACTILAKILIQDLWREKLDWDASLPSNILEKWYNFQKHLNLLNNLKIPRQVVCTGSVRRELHGFCDASTSAYGACLYIRSINEDGSIFVKLLCAKSKVAPVKPTTIPRLELCGALVLARLSDHVIKNFNMDFDSCVLWCDSTIVLGWLKIPPNLLKTFVCNRVAEIQEITQYCTWAHVPTKSNPADLLSRGIAPHEILNSNIWWHGPSWLHECSTSWPSPVINSPDLPDLKQQSNTLISLTNNADFCDFIKFSDLTRLERVVAYCLRFKNNCAKPNQEKMYGPLMVDEIRNAQNCLIKIAQNESFGPEIKQLQNNKSVLNSSKIQSLNPFVDKNGLIRVGGRLRNSNFSFNKCHPILLSGKHYLTKLIFTREHIRLLHAGPQLLLFSVRERFWATSGRNLARSVVHQCVKCFRASPKSISPIMGNLPQVRIQPAPPFFISGVDYAGPIMMKDRKGRGCKKIKCYVCLFVCFVTKALHIELVTDLSTNSFILALRRFVARRGKPSQIFSDNGTCFVGANSQLKELGTFLKGNKSNIVDSMSNEGIKWNFIPPQAPHFGGLWESGVRSCKHHLKRIAGNALLTFEEMYSLLTQIEAILNSRPLTPLSSDPNDLEPLTPAHFLIGRSLVSVPDPNLLSISESKLDNYQKIQHLQQLFWRRWNKEYVAQLQQRTKWRTQQGSLQEGAMVLIREDNLPPLLWKLGRVVQVHPGNDHVNRVATIKTSTGTVKRAFSKICPLPCDKFNKLNVMVK